MQRSEIIGFKHLKRTAALGIPAVMLAVIALGYNTVTPTVTTAVVTSTKPTASNTGVPAGTKLKAVYGDMVVKVPGTVIDSIDLHGALRIEAANVTVKRSILRGSSTVGWEVVYAGDPSVKNLVLQDDEISPTIKSMYTNGVYGHDFTLNRDNIHDVVDSAHIFGGNNVLIENSWLHSNTHFGPTIDKGHPDGSHDDSVEIDSGRNIVIKNTVLSGAFNSGVMVTQGLGVVSSVAVTNNWISGGACAANIAEGTYGKISGLSITGNSFGTTRDNCQILVTPQTKAISTLTGNVLTDGKAVRITCHTPSKNYAC